MTDSAQLRPVSPTPTGVIRVVRDRLDALERDLVAARAALAEAEDAILLAQRRTAPEPVALTTEQVAQLRFSLLQKNVLNRRARATRQDLRIAIVTWTERTYHRRRRQDAHSAG